MYKYLLFYKLITVDNPKNEQKKILRLCQALDIKGRFLVGPDGINGTLAGTKEAIQVYIDYMNLHPLFKDIDYKEDLCQKNPFPRLRVVAREEIVTTESRDKFDLAKRSQHVDRDTFHQWLVDDEDMVVLDLRNDYEWAVGRFKNSVKPPMKYFRDLDNCLAFYEQYKDKKVVTFCTGGIRCEFATPQLIRAGFNPANLYQLEGGIIKYCNKYGQEGYFEGRCFVFDDRITVPGDTSSNPTVVGECYNCSAPTEEFYNCRNASCNKMMLACKDCILRHNRTCSEYCMAVIMDPSKERPERVKLVHRNK